MNEALPSYTDAEVKAALLAAGASGTIYSLVMPESEAAFEAVLDRDRGGLLDLYREAWTQKQDAMHRDYFDLWVGWSRPALDWSPDAFPFRYPTAGASEGIVKLMAEYLGDCRAAGRVPQVHIFDGDYEGFPAFAASLGIAVVRHPREEWQRVAAAAVPAGAQFWISQPSAIDGIVWPHFDAFAAALAASQPTAELVPDLTYVGSVARDYRIPLAAPNIRAFVMSHSKPFGGYYHRVGGVFAKEERPSLLGNRWFKNLLSLAWGSEMMRRHDVYDLPRKYRPVQEEAAGRVGAALGIELQAADVNLLATAPWCEGLGQPLASVGRGSGSEKVVRLCVTAAMASLIDPALAPSTAPDLLARWKGMA
ncbi:hypothetical protein [Sphingomonas jaspsi]|uniref:hypothetical protein n=1 Tax=Sphingomonas jaspsi TaxID=392409 RepID=UPI0004B308FE|nr:hypothetical protein [Sphingomonas jaspsi]